MIIFAIHDDAIHQMAEPHVAASCQTARLSLGRFFAEHEDMRNRMSQTSLVVFGLWDEDEGVRVFGDGPIKFSAQLCFDCYLEEVKKQNEEAISEAVSDNSDHV